MEPSAAATGLNPIDLAAAGIVILTFVLGLRSGFFAQLGGLFGAIAGGAGVLLALPLFLDQLQSMDPPLRALIVVAAFIFAIGLGEALGSAVGAAVRSRLGSGFLGNLDRLTGGFLGAAQGLLIVWLVGGILVAGPIPAVAGWANSSLVVRAMSDLLPPPQVLVGPLGRLLNASGLPQVFQGLAPLPADPVQTPTTPDARAITLAATASTVKVATQACGYELTGTGFSIGRGYYVTNAHVVAGGTKETIVQDGGRAVRVAVVLFDPLLDVAVLWSPDLVTPALTFATADPGKGTKAAALGHPLGAPLKVIPAGVAADYPAQGLDIYGKAVVTRRIIELTAVIQKGDSGGPLILTDGSVGGVIVAESINDPTVGYALSPRDVAARTMPAVGKTKSVATGPCVR